MDGDLDVFVVTGRFSGRSGGRTTAAFHHTAMLASPRHRIHLVTVNHRTDYVRLTRGWLARLGVRGRVDVVNLYDWLADERPDDDVPPVAWAPPAGAERVGGRIWATTAEGGAVARVTLDEDGVLLHRELSHGGTRTLRESYDRRGVLRAVHRYDDGTTELRASDGRPYARVRASEDGTTTVCVLGGTQDTAGEFVPVRELEQRFVATLAHDHPRAVFVVEDRMCDGLVVDNPLLPEPPRSVAVIHSSHLADPRDDIHRVAGLNDVTLGLAPRFTRVVVATGQQRDDIRAHYGPVPNLVQIPHAVHVPWSAVRWRRRPGRAVVLGRLEPVKRLDHVLRAFVLVRESLPWARLDVWGEGGQLGDLRELAAELGLADAVRFRGHTLEPLRVLGAARVSVVTSISEGFGLSMLESLAVGTPVVCYAFRYGPAELVRDGRSGYVVPNGDEEALARAIVTLLSSPRRAWLMGLSGLDVRWRFRAGAVRRRWRALVREVAA